jgi:small-conductance mechanosensitive channel
LEQSVGGSLFVSVMIVPIFLVADRFGQWIVSSVVGETLAPKPSKIGGAGDASPAGTDPEGVHRQRYTVVARHVVRAAVIFALGVWLLRFWGVALPLGQAFLRATFSILVTLVLAHILWRTTIRLINRKLQEEIPPQAADEGQEDEWGAAQALGRHHTLLPMVRKAIGSTLVVMVTMTTLSSLGIDITPLLAGAGVVGLAVGFGARKLVNDIFSGFFFLLDDAFRIGEYLKAGAVSGMVEKITLRNLFLRHHRGMLQVVPYSDLGMVTNYMRGGLVEKFNLQLPYDTDIDKVRKIIKKVGEQMIQDPEHGPHFIQPLKSQGVREVGDSVMTFRVKFTAKPGKHFLIRREAIKRITLALEKAGIHYAHRKVIVDLPRPEVLLAQPSEPGREAGAQAEAVRAVLGAAAAEAVLRQAEEEKAAASKGSKGSDDSL